MFLTKAAGVHVPGVLADVFETIAGAVFVDYGFSFDTVKRVYTPLLTYAYGKLRVKKLFIILKINNYLLTH